MKAVRTEWRFGDVLPRRALGTGKDPATAAARVMFVGGGIGISHFAGIVIVGTESVSYGVGRTSDLFVTALWTRARVDDEVR